MNFNHVLEKYRKHTQRWILLINTLDEKQFLFKPGPTEWCVSEVVDHLTNVTHKCLDNAERCAAAKGETGHSGFGPALFSLMGSFPPVRLNITKIPPGTEHIYHPAQLSKQAAIEKLNLCLQRMHALKDSLEKADRKQRVAHWAGGWFNTAQWYHAAEMHLKHHFRQFKRLEKRFPR